MYLSRPIYYSRVLISSPYTFIIFLKNIPTPIVYQGLYVYQIGKISKKISIENWIYTNPYTFIRILSGLYVYEFLKNMHGYTFISSYTANRNSRVLQYGAHLDTPDVRDICPIGEEHAFKIYDKFTLPRILYDRVQNRKNHFEIPAFLPIE